MDGREMEEGGRGSGGNVIKRAWALASSRAQKIERASEGKEGERREKVNGFLPSSLLLLLLLLFAHFIFIAESAMDISIRGGGYGRPPDVSTSQGSDLRWTSTRIGYTWTKVTMTI